MLYVQQRILCLQDIKDWTSNWTQRKFNKYTCNWMHKTNLIKSFNKNRINEVWLEGLGGVWVNCCTVISPFPDEDPSEDNKQVLALSVLCVCWPKWTKEHYHNSYLMETAEKLSYFYNSNICVFILWKMIDINCLPFWALTVHF